MHHPRSTKLAGRGSRRRGLIAFAVASLLLVPAAIAWACNPQAQLWPDQQSYSPGESMRISGSYFPANTGITISSSSGAVATATTNGSGAFVASMAAPRAAGTYTLKAVRADGQFQSGLPKVASYAVAAPAARAPATRPAPSTTTQPTGSRSFSEPGISRSPVRSVAGSGGSDGGGAQPLSGSTGGVAGGGTVVTGLTGVPVFAGSVAPAQPTFGSAPGVAPARAAAASPARGTAARSTGRAAAADSDVWSGFANGRTPSLTADTADAPDSGTGSSLGLGIGLLAVGLLALVAGLTAAEVRRRRASA